MSFFTEIARFFKSDAGGPADLSRREDDAVFEYLESVLNSKEVAAEELGNYYRLRGESEARREAAYPAAYTALEQVVVKNRPPVVKQAYTAQTLREEVAGHVRTDDLPEGLRLIFAKPAQQASLLGKIAAMGLAEFIASSMGTAELTAALASMPGAISTGALPDSGGRMQWPAVLAALGGRSEEEVAAFFRSLNGALYRAIAGTLGEKTAVDTVQKIFQPVKKGYDYDLISRFLQMLPSNVLEDERITFLSRQELEDRIRRATAELVLERDRAKAVITSMGEGLLVVDEDQKITALNAAAERLLHTTAPAALGSVREGLYDLYRHDQALDRTEWPVAITLSQRKQVTIGVDDDYSCRTKDGASFPVALTTTPLLEGEKVRGVVTVFRDVSQEKEATATIERQVQERTREVQEARARLVASINSLELGFIITRNLDDLVIVNQAAARILKFEGEPGSIPLSEIVRTLSACIDLEAELRRCFTTFQPAEFDGLSFQDLFVHLFISPIVLDGTAIGCTILVEDITELRIMERSKDEFFSIASHELRTPLTAIRGYTEILRDMYAHRVSEQQFDQILRNIDEGSRRMISLVNDFLNMSGLEQGKILFKKEPFDLAALLREVCQELSPIAEHKGLAVKFTEGDPLPPVFADRDRLKQVVFNLVGNALKFTDKGGITVDAVPGRENVEVQVRDTGKGISPHNQHLLFRKFQQAGESLLTRDASHGTGLGLYISKLMVEGMGGEIGLKSSVPGEGSVFSFTVPMAKGQEPSEQSNSQ